MIGCALFSCDIGLLRSCILRLLLTSESSVENPLLYYRNNVVGSISLLKTVNRFGPLPIVFSSSCVTYGIPSSVPISEDHPQQPINPYGHSKLFVERILADLERASALPWVSLRYFNAAGCGSGWRNRRGA